VNNNLAVVNGALANKPRFFGSSTAETVAAASVTGSWNGDAAYSVYSIYPWFQRGSRSNQGATAGIFHFDDHNGDDYQASVSHRTILSGY
jgi:hypothetical protein